MLNRSGRSLAGPVLGALFALLGAAARADADASSNVPAEAVAPAVDLAPPELQQPPFLFEVVRHLYRWYLDEGDVERVADRKQFPFWIRELHPPLDPGDRSRLGEIILPLLGVSVRLKQADYRIDELKVTVRSKGFKIVNVARIDVPAARPADCALVEVDLKSMLDYLFRTRAQRDYPDAALGKRLRQAVAEQVGEDDKSEAGDQAVYVSPLSPVANELWVFWETHKMLIRFASDIDLANTAVWDHETLAVRTYDIEKQVVVALGEAAGSNAFMTRDQVGRALYNCIVFGRRMTITPTNAPAAASAEPAAVSPSAGSR
jgi:hypothetical protein